MTFAHPPSGLREAFEDARSGLTLENQAFYFAFIDQTVVAIVEELRRYFQTNPRVAAAGYRWRGEVRENGEIETAVDSKVHIAAEHPDQAKRWPSVLVREVSGSVRDLWLGQKAGTLYAPNPNYSAFDESQAQISGDNYDEQPDIEVGERYEGRLEMRVTLAVTAIGAGARTECNRVADLLLHGLVMPVRRALAQRSFNWMPDGGSFGGEAMSSYQGADRGKECVRTLTFGLQTGWYDDFFYVSEIVEKIDLKRVYLVGPDPR
jgi:hypothetical protein